MSDKTETRQEQLRSSRDRYRRFVQDYRQQRLDDSDEAGHQAHNGPAKPAAPKSTPESKRERRAKRRTYVREYLRWLKPHRYAVGVLFILALLTAGLQLLEPLFMRFIIDKVLLNSGL